MHAYRSLIVLALIATTAMAAEGSAVPFTVAGRPAPPNACATVGADTLKLGFTFEPDRRDTAAPVLVTLQLPPMRDSSLMLALPNSTAGRSQLYQNIVNFRALSHGARAESTDRPDRVRIVAHVGDTVTVAWRLHTTPRSYTSADAHNHSDIGPEWAQIVGYDAMVVPDTSRDTPVCATVAFRGLASGDAAATSFGVPRAGAPVDSTIVVRGSLNDLRYAVYVMAMTSRAVHSYTTAIPGGALTVLVRGRHAINDSTLDDQVRRVITAIRAFWGTAPTADYLITIGVAPRGSLNGVRLGNAFVADIDSTFSMNERVRGLFAHELTHQWISGVLHASSAVPVGELYWFTEGFDDFMAHRIMHAAGLLSDSGYVSAVNRALRDHALSSVRDSSWAAVVRHARNEADAYQEQYSRGELIAFLLNSEIARASNGRTTLDSLLRQMARRPAAELAGGFSPAALDSELAGPLGRDRAHAIISGALAGGAITLPRDALGACATPSIVERTRSGPASAAGVSVAVTVQQWSIDPACRSPSSRTNQREPSSMILYSLHHEQSHT
jgi:predicted metalloprotease with PDZ domain